MLVYEVSDPAEDERVDSMFLPRSAVCTFLRHHRAKVGIMGDDGPRNGDTSLTCCVMFSQSEEDMAILDKGIARVENPPFDSDAKVRGMRSVDIALIEGEVVSEPPPKDRRLS